MYKLNTIKRVVGEKEIVFYGIESEDVNYPDISSNKDKMENLCNLCNSLDVDSRQIKDIIDDLLASHS